MMMDVVVNLTAATLMAMIIWWFWMSGPRP